MATLSELQTRREEIIAQMTGPSEMRFGSRMVRNRSMQELQKLLEMTNQEIAAVEASTGGDRPVRIVYARTGTGH
jgi:uncharacterized protein YukE